jgi:hypothetical protein
MPWNRLLTVRAKRPARPVNREINRPPVNTDVQKRSDRCAKHKRERSEEEFVNRLVHALAGDPFQTTPLHEPRDPDAALIK